MHDGIKSVRVVYIRSVCKNDRIELISPYQQAFMVLGGSQLEKTIFRFSFFKALIFRLKLFSVWKPASSDSGLLNELPDHIEY